MAREIAAVRGIETTTDSFRRKFIELADRYGLNPSYFAAVVAFESGFDPAARNKSTNATGLIQFMPGTAVALGTTVEELSKMTAEEQLPYVEKFVQTNNPSKRVHSIEDHYAMVFAPAYIGKGPDAVFYSAPSDAYEKNKKLDIDGDGHITASEAATYVKQIYNAAMGRAPIVVDMDGTSPGTDPGPVPLPVPVESASLGYLVLGGVVGLGIVYLAKKNKRKTVYRKKPYEETLFGDAFYRLLRPTRSSSRLRR